MQTPSRHQVLVPPSAPLRPLRPIMIQSQRMPRHLSVNLLPVFNRDSDTNLQMQTVDRQQSGIMDALVPCLPIAFIGEDDAVVPAS